MTKKQISAGRPGQGLDTDDALELVMQMMAVPGPSGEEGAVAELIVELLRAAGAEADWIMVDDVHKRSPLGGQVGNLICKLPGTVRGPRRLLMAHLDTVPLAVGARPVRRGRYIRSARSGRGLGADNRSGCAAILQAALQIMRYDLPHPPLTFLWSVQEEVGLFGARYVRIGDLGNPRLCFNWDGNAPYSLTVGATGAYRLRVEIKGRASHAGLAPEQGVSAAAIAAAAVADLQAAGWHGLVQKGRRRGTSNVGIITAGQATNVVADRATVRAEVRSHDPAFRRRILAAYHRAFERAASRIRSSAGKTGSVRFHEQLDYESFKLPESCPVVVEARRAVRAVGLEPQTKIANGGLDANWLTARRRPTVTLGTGQQSVHTAQERLHVPSYLAACRVALAVATGADATPA